MEYTISRSEITRRKKAYATLSASLMVGLVLSSWILHFPVSFPGYLSVAFALFLLGAFSFRFFRKLLKIRINLSNLFLERTVNGVSEKYPLNEICRMTVKRKTDHTIREVYIWLRDDRSVFMTALDRFEEFEKSLSAHVAKDVVIKEVHELLNFDHPLFYSLLGLPISFCSLLVLQRILFSDYQDMKIWMIALFVYLFVFGVYFLFFKPISKRSGKKTVALDYTAGLFMFGSSIVILLFFFG